MTPNRLLGLSGWIYALLGVFFIFSSPWVAEIAEVPLDGALIGRVGIEPAIIFDRRQNKEYHTHQSVKVGQSFSSSEINDLNLDGDRLLFMGNEYLFVSPSLKSKLANGPFKYLEFSEGLYGFAGSRV